MLDNENNSPSNDQNSEEYVTSEITISDDAGVPSEKLDEDQSIVVNNGKELDTKGNKKSTFWFISIFSSTGQFFFGNFFSAFAAQVGVSGALMGFITSIRNLFSSIFQGIIGFLSDHIGRKLIMLIGIFVNFAITIPLLFFESRGLIVAIAIVQALSLSVFMPAWNAVLGDVTKPEFRAAFIARISSIGRLVSVIFSIVIAIIFYLGGEGGPLNGQVILGWTVNIPWRVQYSIAFGIAAVNSLICTIIIAFMKETRPKEAETRHPDFRVAFRSRNFMKFVVFYALFGFTMSFIWPLNPIVQINVLNMEFYQLAIIVSIFIIVMSVVQVLAGILCDKYGRKPIFLIGAFVLALYPVSMIPAIMTGRWGWLILGNVIAGMGAGMFFVSLNALTLDLAPDNLMGAYSGVREMFFGLATFAGSLSAGFIVDALELNYGLQVAVIAICIGVSVLRFLTAFGFIFVTESLPKEVREQRINGNNSKIAK